MKIFVSYRRADSAGWTGRLAADLSARFGESNVFLDIHSVDPGVDYVAEIKSTLARADYTLVVIGPAWLGATDKAGNRRLDNAYDPVRMEVALALQSKSRVIPILVGGAKMPSETMLPADMKALATRNALEVTDHRWSEDVRHLIELLAGKVWWQRIGLVVIGIIQVTFIALWIYQITIQDTVKENEDAASVWRERYIEKMRAGSDECMAGVWPKGAVKGPTYRENGNMVTEPCRGVSFALNYFQRFFNEEQLWRMQPSLQTAARFADTYKEVFERDFKPTLESGWDTPLSATALNLAEKARDELATQAREVVAHKQNAGQAAVQLTTLQQLTRAGLYWTIIVGLGSIFWFSRGAINLGFLRRASAS
jgi:hypothetical protein